MTASAPCRNCRPFRPSRAAFASAAPSRRWSNMLPSSAIIGCWMSRELMTSLPKAPSAVDIDSLLVVMRPRLHRYCARMVGSVIDGEDVLMIADQFDEITSRQIAIARLRTFMRLPVAQRATMILTDVLGCSLQEI